MRRRPVALGSVGLTFVAIAAALVARPPESEEARLLRLAPGLRIVGHDRTPYGEMWLADDASLRLSAAVRGRPGWMAEIPFSTRYKVWHFYPSEAPTWRNRLPFLRDHRRQVGLTLEPGRWRRKGDRSPAWGGFKIKLWTFDAEYPDDGFPDVTGWR